MEGGGEERGGMSWGEMEWGVVRRGGLAGVGCVRWTGGLPDVAALMTLFDVRAEEMQAQTFSLCL